MTLNEIRVRNNNLQKGYYVMNDKSVQRARKFTFSAVPLVLCLLTTALLLQRAFAMRSLLITDDAVTDSILSFIHPASLVFLAAGYLLSIAVLLVPLAVSGKPDSKQ